MRALLLLAALVSCVNAQEVFGDYATDQEFRRREGEGEHCILPCVVNTTISLDYINVRWYGEYKSEVVKLNDFPLWAEAQVQYSLNYSTHGSNWCIKNGLLLDCSLTLTHCNDDNLANYARNYLCSVSASTVGEIFNVSSVITDPTPDAIDGDDCHLPSAENITATLFNDGDIQKVNVSWDSSTKPPGIEYCDGARQWSIRTITFPSPANIRDNDTTTKYPLLTYFPLPRRTTFFEIPKAVDKSLYYIFQLQNKDHDISHPSNVRDHSSSIYHFNEQVAPYLVNTVSKVVVAEGGSVEIICEAGGIPTPHVHIVRNGRILELTNNRYLLVDVSVIELGSYYCSASNTIVNPPRGKHKRTVNKKISLEFIPALPSLQKKCVSYDGSYCRKYLYGDTTVYVNDTDFAIPGTTIASFLGDIGVYHFQHLASRLNESSYANISEELVTKCFNFMEALACSVVFPYCDLTQIPRPICKHSCDVLSEECGFFLDATLLPGYEYGVNVDRIGLMAKCDTRENPAGSNPECIYISFESPVVEKSDVLTQALCVSGKGRGYNGGIFRTVSGTECQSWESQNPHKHSLKISHHNEELIHAGYSCRNPGGLGEKPWCYTSDPSKRWEYCDVPQCEQCNGYSGMFCADLPGYSDGLVYTNSIDWPTGLVSHSALESTMNILYNTLWDRALSPGCQQATRTLICHGTLPLCSQQGNPRPQCNEHCSLFNEMLLHCPTSLTDELMIRWNSTYAVTRLNPPNCGQDSESEKCSPSPQRIQSTPDKYQECYNSSDSGQTYSGDIAITKTGKTCISWSHSPLTHPYPELTNNYCRNPGQWKAVPWCFIDKNTIEICDIPECEPPGNNLKGPKTDGQFDTGAVVAIAFFLVALLICGIIVAAIFVTRYAKRREIAHSPTQLSKVTSDKMKDMEYQHNGTYGNIITFPPKIAETIASFQQIPQDKIEYVKQLGQGFFGMVFKGRLRSMVDGDPEMFVAVKTLKEDCNDGIEAFVNEAKLMFGFHHPNIVQILGVSMNKTPYYLVFEYMDKGDLAKFLRENASSLQRRHMSPNDRSRSRTESTLSDDPAALNNPQLIDLCKQIAVGMEYLSGLKHVHRDLACRNCLVKSIPDDSNTVTDSRVIVKIGDFGLSHNLYTKDYYRVRGQAVLPIRWMSPEAIVYGKFSTAGDVWSFGVVMWEIFAFGMQPYYGISNEEVMERVRHGRILDMPMDCPNRVYSIMSDCWAIQDHNRPTFVELCKLLSGCELESTSTEDDAQSVYSYDSGDVFESEPITDIDD